MEKLAHKFHPRLLAAILTITPAISLVSQNTLANEAQAASLQEQRGGISKKICKKIRAAAAPEILVVLPRVPKLSVAGEDIMNFADKNTIIRMDVCVPESLAAEFVWEDTVAAGPLIGIYSDLPFYYRGESLRPKKFKKAAQGEKAKPGFPFSQWINRNDRGFRQKLHILFAPVLKPGQTQRFYFMSGLYEPKEETPPPTSIPQEMNAGGADN